MQRLLVLLFLLLTALPILAADLSLLQQWTFRVLLDGKDIGLHTFSLHKTADVTHVTSTARFDVKVLFFNAYQYIHEAQEVWRADCLSGMTARTNDNGRLLSVNVVEHATGMVVTTDQKQFGLSGCVMSFAYWNPGILRQSQLLNAQTGEYEQVTVQLLRTTTLHVAGKEWAARQYKLKGRKLDIDLWYSLEGEWLALESTTENGSRLRYVLS